MTTAELERLREQLILHEGLRLKPYRDTVGKLTIGVGRNLDDKGISPTEAIQFLDHDIEDVSRELRAGLPCFLTLDGVRQSVLIDMGFMGVARLLQFKKMIAALERQNYQGAAAEMLLSKWASQVGHRAVTLADMMFTGERT